jgi:hypothetical protein
MPSFKAFAMSIYLRINERYLTRKSRESVTARSMQWAMVEGSKFRESHVLKILAKEGGIPRPLVVHCPDL